MTIRLGVFNTTDRIEHFVSEALESGRLSYGPLTEQLENRWAELHGARYGVATNSGTDALVVALEAMAEASGDPDRDQVILPATTFVASYNAVRHAGLVPILADVSDDWLMDSEKMMDRVGPHTLAVMPVHLFGLAYPFDELENIPKSVFVIEDSCESVLTVRDNHDVGSYGDAGCFSFYMAHHLPAGVGGMAITRSESLARLMRSYVNHGLAIQYLPRPDKYDPSWLGRNFVFTRHGHSSRLSEMSAAIALGQLDSLRVWVQRRRQIGQMLMDGLAEINREYDNPYHFFQGDPEHHSFMVFPIALNRGSLDTIKAKLRGASVEVRDGVPLVTQPVYATEISPTLFPNAFRFAETTYYVPCHQGLSPGDVRRILDVHAEYAKELSA